MPLRWRAFRRAAARARGTAEAAASGAALKVVATVFPAYDWTREVIGDNADNVELTLLMDSGTDLRNASLIEQ